MSEELKVNIAAQLGEIDEDIKRKVINFTNALEELPHNLLVDVLIDGKVNKTDEPLKINLGELLVEQVKHHFGIKDKCKCVNKL